LNTALVQNNFLTDSISFWIFVFGPSSTAAGSSAKGNKGLESSIQSDLVLSIHNELREKIFF